MVYQKDTDQLLIWDGTAWYPPKNTAWGVLGKVTSTSGYSTTSSHNVYQDNGISASISYGPNRLIKVTYQAMGIAISTANDILWRCVRGSTTLDEFTVPQSSTAAGNGYTWYMSFQFVSTAAATETFNMQIRGGNNTQVVEYISGPTKTRQFIVQDIGPA